MKKTIITICLSGSIIIILDSLNFSQHLLMFVLVGLIPWTNIYLSPIDTMAATATAITIVLLRATIWPKVRNYLFGPLVQATKKSSGRMAKA